MEHFSNAAVFSGRKTITLTCFILLLGIVIGSRAYGSSDSSGMNDTGASHMDYVKMVFSPEQIRLPSTENEMSRRYLKIMTLWIPTAMEYFNDKCGEFVGYYT